MTRIDLLRSASVLGLAVALGPAASAGDLVRSNGTLGDKVTYDLTGTPGAIYVLAPSLTVGPLALAMFDPTDPRFLDVGFELFTFWSVGILDGAGQATADLPLPLAANLHDLPLYAQFVEVVFFPSFFGAISNRVEFTLGLPCESHTAFGPNSLQMDSHTATTLLDGRVLLAGGRSDSGTLLTPLDGFQLYEPQTQAVNTTTGTMQHIRQAHTATLLADGRVLVLGGSDDMSIIRRTGDIWDPATGTVTPTPDMSVARAQHSATLLNDGRVFVAGGLGSFDFADPLAALNSAQDSTEIYDPTTNTWTPGPLLDKGLAGHSATLLGDGRVLLAGGLEVDSLFGLPVPSLSDSAVRYDPPTNTLVPTASFADRRVLSSILTLDNGDALLVGGADGIIATLNFTALTSTRRYDHVQNTWSNTADLNHGRAFCGLLRTTNDIVAIGGASTVQLATLTGQPVLPVEITDQLALAWTQKGNTVLPRQLVQYNLIEGGSKVLTTGRGDNGSGGFTPDFTSEIFLP